jgi:hypothetical protein
MGGNLDKRLPPIAALSASLPKKLAGQGNRQPAAARANPAARHSNHLKLTHTGKCRIFADVRCRIFAYLSYW